MSIEICHVCDGYGYTNVTEPDSLVIEKMICQRCEGSGRLVRTKTYDTLSSHGIGEVKPPDAFQPAVADGWKMTPVEPTYEMAEAAKDIAWPERRTDGTRHPSDVHDAALDCYRAMLTAAPHADGEVE